MSYLVESYNIIQDSGHWWRHFWSRTGQLLLLYLLQTYLYNLYNMSSTNRPSGIWALQCKYLLITSSCHGLCSNVLLVSTSAHSACAMQYVQYAWGSITWSIAVIRYTCKFWGLIHTSGIAESKLVQFLPCDTILARYMPSSYLCLSFCLSVCVYYARYKTAKPRIMQRMPHDSPSTPSFCVREIYTGSRSRWSGLKSATFDNYLVLMVRDRCIVYNEVE